MTFEKRQEYIFKLEEENRHRKLQNELRVSEQKNRDNLLSCGIGVINSLMTQQFIASAFGGLYARTNTKD